MKAALAVLTISALLLAGPTHANGLSPDEAAIEYRQHVMSALEAQFNAIALIVAFNGPSENLMSHLQTALIAARQSLPSFEARVPGGSSKRVIWEQWKDYTAHMRQFEAAIAMAVEAAKFGTVTDVVWYTDQISCRKCHDIYRQPQISGGEDYRGY